MCRVNTPTTCLTVNDHQKCLEIVSKADGDLVHKALPPSSQSSQATLITQSSEVSASAALQGVVLRDAHSKDNSSIMTVSLLKTAVTPVVG